MQYCIFCARRVPVTCQSASCSQVMLSDAECIIQAQELCMWPALLCLLYFIFRLHKMARANPLCTPHASEG